MQIPLRTERGALNDGNKAIKEPRNFVCARDTERTIKSGITAALETADTSTESEALPQPELKLCEYALDGN